MRTKFHGVVGRVYRVEDQCNTKKNTLRCLYSMLIMFVMFVDHLLIRCTFIYKPDLKYALRQ